MVSADRQNAGIKEEIAASLGVAEAVDDVADSQDGIEVLGRERVEDGSKPLVFRVNVPYGAESVKGPRLAHSDPLPRRLLERRPAPMRLRHVALGGAGRLATQLSEHARTRSGRTSVATRSEIQTVWAPVS
jgi:hypothetical protein